MPIDPYVINPKSIRRGEEIEDILVKMSLYKKGYTPSHSVIGVLFIQRRQFPALFRVESEENAINEMKKLITSTSPEFPIGFYPQTYFKEMKRMLQETGKIDYGALERYIFRREEVTPYRKKDVLGAV
ncbi:hypothetical protein HY498_01675 [Candidatus Woesearchaeota archaeon]|nr:hypothetical protein [Candidatus Woesearchaeota archaeon]